MQYIIQFAKAVHVQHQKEGWVWWRWQITASCITHCRQFITRKSGFQLSVESNFSFALVLLYFALWLVDRTRATFSTNEKQNQNQSSLARTRFSTLGDWPGSSVKLLSLVLVLRHSTESCSKRRLKLKSRQLMTNDFNYSSVVYSG